MLGQGYFDEKGGYVETAELVGITIDSNRVDRQPATLNVAQPLSAADPTEVLAAGPSAMGLSVFNEYSGSSDQGS